MKTWLSKEKGVTKRSASFTTFGQMESILNKFSAITIAN
jgi:hypothetical protein